MATEQEINDFFEIVKHNCELAKIDGYREIKDWNGYEYGYCRHRIIDYAVIADVELDYHSNWNSLIRVIKALLLLPVKSNDMLSWKVYLAAIGTSLTTLYDKKVTYEKVIEALIWYQSTQHEIQDTPGDKAI